MGIGFGVAGIGDEPAAEGPTFAELGWLALPLGAGSLFLLLTLNALVHRGQGTMYCETGLPGITTWSAGSVCTLALILVAFAALCLGASIGMTPGEEGTLSSEDLAVGAIFALGGWLASVTFVPLRREIRRVRSSLASRR